MTIDLKSGLSREGVSQRLGEKGLHYTVATLANMASNGEGPLYRLIGGRAVYMPDDVDRWAESRISAPIRKAADARRGMTDTSVSAADVAQRSTMSPLLVSVREFRRQLGGIGNTAAYAAIKRHKVQVLHLGGRALIAMSEVERIVAELKASAVADANDEAKALVSRSVAARRARRGSVPVERTD